MHPQRVVLRAQARGQKGLNHALAQLGPQVFLGTPLAALKHLQQRMVHVLGRHRLHRLALQVVALLARGHHRQVGRGAGVKGQRGLERLARKKVRMRGQNVLKNAALERQKSGTEQLRIERRELL